MALAVSAMMGPFKPNLRNAPGRRVTVQDRHPHVHQNEIEATSSWHVDFEQINCSMAVFRHGNLRTGLLENQADQELAINTVFDP